MWSRAKIQPINNIRHSPNAFSHSRGPYSEQHISGVNQRREIPLPDRTRETRGRKGGQEKWARASNPHRKLPPPSTLLYNMAQAAPWPNHWHRYQQAEGPKTTFWYRQQDCWKLGFVNVWEIAGWLGCLRYWGLGGEGGGCGGWRIFLGNCWKASSSGSLGNHLKKCETLHCSE